MMRQHFVDRLVLMAFTLTGAISLASESVAVQLINWAGAAAACNRGDVFVGAERWCSNNLANSACEWQGFFCNGHSPISLVLTNRGLQGTFPPELAELTALQLIDLSNNMLTGTIPEEVGLLNQLETLNLKGNFIGGDLPASLGNLALIQFIDLSSNRLTKELPSEIDLLLKLEYLYLDDNEFYGTIPASLFQSCSSSNQCNLKEFSVSNNELTGTMPLSMGGIESLHVIDVSSNFLHGGIPPAVQARVISSFDCSNNYMLGNCGQMRSCTSEVSCRSNEFYQGCATEDGIQDGGYGMCIASIAYNQQEPDSDVRCSAYIEHVCMDVTLRGIESTFCCDKLWEDPVEEDNAMSTNQKITIAAISCGAVILLTLAVEGGRRREQRLTTAGRGFKSRVTQPNPNMAGSITRPAENSRSGVTLNVVDQSGSGFQLSSFSKIKMPGGGGGANGGGGHDLKVEDSYSVQGSSYADSHSVHVQGSGYADSYNGDTQTDYSTSIYSDQPSGPRDNVVMNAEGGFFPAHNSEEQWSGIEGPHRGTPSEIEEGFHPAVPRSMTMTPVSSYSYTTGHTTPVSSYSYTTAESARTGTPNSTMASPSGRPAMPTYHGPPSQY